MRGKVCINMATCFADSASVAGARRLESYFLSATDQLMTVASILPQGQIAEHDIVIPFSRQDARVSRAIGASRALTAPSHPRGNFDRQVRLPCQLPHYT